MNNHGVDELERQIADRLNGHSRRAPDNDGWEAILDRIEHRGRARHRRRAATTGLVMVGMVASLVVLTGDDDTTRVSTTSAGPATPALSTPAGSLPRLVLDFPGFDLTRAAHSEAGGPGPDLGPLLVYTAPGDGLLGVGPVVFARLVPAGAAYGIGDGPDMKPVDVDGQPGRLIATSGTVTSLGWPREDGSLVHLIAHGLPDDDLLAAGQALEGALALGQAAPTTLPGGIALSRVTRPEGSRWDQTEVSYGSGSRLVELRLTTGGAYEHDSLVLDRMASSSSWRSASVDGRAANLATYQGSDDVAQQARTLIWVVDDGAVAELTSHGLTEAELEAAAASIRQIDEGQWDELVARFEGAPPVGQEVAPAADAYGRVHGRDLRHPGPVAGGPGRRRRRSCGRGGGRSAGHRREGPGGRARPDGDILVVAQRLLDAMAAGDDALVSSIPEGGACS